MKHKLNYHDFIDLEFFFHQDTARSPEQLIKRDRSLFIKKSLIFNGSKQDRLNLIKVWLSERIDQEFPKKDQKTPGGIFKDSLALLKTMCVMIGCLFGVTAGLSFFTYSGTTPVNVFHFLIFFVFSQILLTIFLASSLAIRRLARAISLPSFYSLFFGRLFEKLTMFITRQWGEKSSAAKKQSFNHAIGLIRSNSRLYGSLFYWPLFTLSQIVALFFNIGLLTTTLFRIGTSDLAFGWQSTLQFSSSALHELIMVMALPWSWYIPRASAFPSLEEIEGSRIILKEGIYNLATTDLIAWWPFLIFCLLFYGLFFRAIFYLVGKRMEKKALQKISFDTAPYHRLIQRMVTPIVTTQALPEDAHLEKPPLAEPSSYNADACQTILPQLVLIPDDIYHKITPTIFNSLLHSHGFKSKEQLKFMLDYDTDQEIIDRLKKERWPKDTGILIIIEAWMVPLVDFLTYLTQLRTATTSKTIISVALIGRPAATIFTTVSKNDYTLWQQKIGALGDPYLNLFSFVIDTKRSKS